MDPLEESQLPLHCTTTCYEFCILLAIQACLHQIIRICNGEGGALYSYMTYDVVASFSASHDSFTTTSNLKSKYPGH